MADVKHSEAVRVFPCCQISWNAAFSKGFIFVFQRNNYVTLQILVILHSSNNQGQKTEWLKFKKQNDAQLMALLTTTAYCSHTLRVQRHHNSPGIPFHRFQMWKSLPQLKRCIHEKGVSEFCKLHVFYGQVKKWL